MRRIVQIAIFVGLSWTATGYSGDAVYTWVDETGQVHYTDQWVAGCEKVEMPEFPAPSPARSALAPVPVAAGPAEQQIPEESPYQVLRALSPVDDECLRRVGGIVKVMVEIDPAPQPGKLLRDPRHRLLVSVDGKAPQSEFVVGLQDGLLALFLTDVFRGTHTLQIMIEDENGRLLAQSDVSSFHVQQISQIILRQQREQRAKRLRQNATPPQP